MGRTGSSWSAHCRDRDDDEQNLLEEYLVYRSYYLLTDESFGVRLARITYADGEDDDDPVVRYAFFIEEAEAMAERLGGVYLEVRQALPGSFGAEDAVRVSVFQYMIGNTDWSMVRFHNTEVLQNSEGVYVPVPYDFDWTGFVSARYARPDERLRIRNVRQRIYRGFCRPNFDFSAVYAQFVRFVPISKRSTPAKRVGGGQPKGCRGLPRRLLRRYRVPTKGQEAPPGRLPQYVVRFDPTSGGPMARIAYFFLRPALECFKVFPRVSTPGR